MTSKCPSCNRYGFFAFRTRDLNRRLSDETFEYYVCRVCDVYFIGDIPADLGRFYPTQYYPLSQTRAELRISAQGERHKLDLITRFAGAGRFLEIGPGGGRLCLLAQDAGYNVCAIDRDARAAAVLSEQLGIHVELSQEPATAVRRLGSFDVIAMWHVIEHVPAPFELFAACAAALAPAGILIIATPNAKAFQFRIFRGRWAHVDAPRHLSLISEHALSEHARRQSLEKIFYTTNDPQGPDAFGWAQSFRNTVPAPFSNRITDRIGYSLPRVLDLFDGGRLSDSAFTAIYRRSLDHTSGLA